jgi:hypothetical protein
MDREAYRAYEVREAQIAFYDEDVCEAARGFSVCASTQAVARSVSERRGAASAEPARNAGSPRRFPLN